MWNAESFFIPEDIGEIGQFTPYIMIGDAQVIPVGGVFLCLVKLTCAGRSHKNIRG